MGPARLVLGVTGAATLPTMVVADPIGGWYEGHMFGDWHGGPWMMLVVGALLAVIVVVILRAFGGMRGGDASGQDSKSPLDTLRERYARGEIDKAGFEDAKRALAE